MTGVLCFLLDHKTEVERLIILTDKTGLYRESFVNKQVFMP